MLHSLGRRLVKSSVFGSVALAVILPNSSVSFSASMGVAELTSVKGKVLLNHGDGFEAVTDEVLLNVGDKIIVGDKSSAQINYLSSGCVVTVSASSMSTISEAAPCKAGEVVGLVDSLFVQPVAFSTPPNPMVPVVIGGVVGASALALAGPSLFKEKSVSP